MQPEQQCRTGSELSDVYVSISLGDKPLGLTIVLKLEWGCRPIIMLASMHKAVAVKLTIIIYAHVETKFQCSQLVKSGWLILVDGSANPSRVN